MTISEGNKQARELVNKQASKCFELSFRAILSAKNHDVLQALQKEFVRLNTMGSIGSALEQMENSGLLDDQNCKDPA